MIFCSASIKRGSASGILDCKLCEEEEEEEEKVGILHISIMYKYARRKIMDARFFDQKQRIALK